MDRIKFISASSLIRNSCSLNRCNSIYHLIKCINTRINIAHSLDITFTDRHLILSYQKTTNSINTFIHNIFHSQGLNIGIGTFSKRWMTRWQWLHLVVLLPQFTILWIISKFFFFASFHMGGYTGLRGSMPSTETVTNWIQPILGQTGKLWISFQRRRLYSSCSPTHAFYITFRNTSLGKRLK